MIEVFAVDSPQERSGLCERVLRALPAWFGIEESLMNYVGDVAGLPFFAARLDEREAGFVAIKEHTRWAAELCVMGVLPWAHRKGVGRALVERCEQACCEMGKEFLTVKTLADTHPDEGYAGTRRFYLAMGFRPLEVFPTLWDEANPCMLMVKIIC
ncbi:MAG: GNAT family N-acetyltransferase [Clostridia bacterium]|nr:GNAT family N-acetyltransferase [Clostridia bacterium]